MNTKRYRIKDGVLRFEDDVTIFTDYLYIPEGVKRIEFNNVERFTKPLKLDHLPLLKYIDFAKVAMLDTLSLPANIIIREDFYWVNKLILKGLITIEHSSRMHYLGIYNYPQRPIIYLSGTVGYGRGNHAETLKLREQQRDLLIKHGFGVYSPGNHMTVGTEFADKNPKLVADIDIKAMEIADIIFFDLHYLSAGTCAELGYTIAAGWHITKELYYMYTDTKNFFINGLLRYMNRVDSLEQFIERSYNL